MLIFVLLQCLCHRTAKSLQRKGVHVGPFCVLFFQGLQPLQFRYLLYCLQVLSNSFFKSVHLFWFSFRSFAGGMIHLIPATLSHLQLERLCHLTPYFRTSLESSGPVVVSKSPPCQNYSTMVSNEEVCVIGLQRFISLQTTLSSVFQIASIYSSLTGYRWHTAWQTRKASPLSRCQLLLWGLKHCFRMSQV